MEASLIDEYYVLSAPSLPLDSTFTLACSVHIYSIHSLPAKSIQNLQMIINVVCLTTKGFCTSKIPT
jgi:hypothetical protein